MRDYWIGIGALVFAAALCIAGIGSCAAAVSYGWHMGAR
jgi:hypothetical protein